eukprot:SAG31_NODE_1145_length_9684_cov_12.800209_12_plen_253_part_00
MVCTERRGLRSRATAGACLVVWAAAVTMLGGAGGANAFVPLPAPECLLPGSWGQTWQIASVASPLELLLSSAVSGGYMQLATMLTSIVDANSALPGMAGRTALHGAAAGGNAAAVLGLVQRGGADSNVRDDLGRAPLHYAVHAQLEMAASLGNETDVVAALLSTGCDPNAEDRYVKSFLRISKIFLVTRGIRGVGTKRTPEQVKVPSLLLARLWRVRKLPWRYILIIRDVSCSSAWAQRRADTSALGREQGG